MLCSTACPSQRAGSAAVCGIAGFPAEKGAFMKTWFITGGSTGLGRCIAEAALARGDQVAVAAIDPENMQDYLPRFDNRVLVQYLDVTSEDMVKETFAEAVRKFGRVDICVNNAGFMHLGAVEELTQAEVRKLMDTNFMGNFFVAKQAAKHMREQGGGVIVQMASLAAVDVLAGNGLYGASKWAVEGLSEALYHEMKPFGVKVIIVEPGTIKTGIARRSRHSEPLPAYHALLADVRKRWVDCDDSGDTGDPVKCAKILLKLVDLENPPVRIPLTTFAYEISQEVCRNRLVQAEHWLPYSRMADIAYDGPI